MIIQALLKQAEDFGFDIFQSFAKVETNQFMYPELDEVDEDTLSDRDNYEFWSEGYDESQTEPFYDVTGYVSGKLVEHQHLSDDEILTTLEEMVLTELNHKYFRFANFDTDDKTFEGMSGLAVYLTLKKVDKAKRDLPLFVYDGNSGNQYDITGLDNNGFRFDSKATDVDKFKLISINDALAILDQLSIKTLNKPLPVHSKGKSSFISDVSPYDSEKSVSETNHLIIYKNL